MTTGMVFHIARQELLESVRTRWFLAYAAALTLFMVALALATLSGGAQVGVMSRASAGLVHLILLVVPLLGLTAGSLSVSSERERGTLGYLLAQPVNRSEVFFGKWLGLNVSLWLALTWSFGLTGVILAVKGSPLGVGSFGGLFGLSALLATTSLTLGYWVSVRATRVVSALGAGIALWLGQVIAGDLGIVGTAVAMDLGIVQVFVLSLFNPLQLFKVAAVGSLTTAVDVLGPVGTYTAKLFGPYLVPVFALLLLAWTVIAAWFAWAAFRKGEYLQ